MAGSQSLAGENETVVSGQNASPFCTLARISRLLLRNACHVTQTRPAESVAAAGNRSVPGSVVSRISADRLPSARAARVEIEIAGALRGIEDPCAALPIHGHRGAHDVLARGGHGERSGPRALRHGVVHQQHLVAARRTRQEREVRDGLRRPLPGRLRSVAVHELRVRQVHVVARLRHRREVLLLVRRRQLKLSARLRHQRLAVQKRLAGAERHVARREAEVPLRGRDVELHRGGRSPHLDDHPVLLHRAGRIQRGRRARAHLPAGGAVDRVRSFESPAAQDFHRSLRHRNRPVPVRGRRVAHARGSPGTTAPALPSWWRHGSILWEEEIAGTAGSADGDRDENNCPQGRPSSHGTVPPAALPALAIRRLGSQLQLFVDLVQQVLGLLRVPLHVELVGFLCRDNPLPGLLAQPLCRCQVGVPAGRDVFLRPLGKGQPPSRSRTPASFKSEFRFVSKRIVDPPSRNLALEIVQGTDLFEAPQHC